MDFRRFAIFTLAAGFILVFAAGPAAASEQTAVMASVHQFFNGINKGDATMAVAACASPASVVDDFAPHAWQGPTACADWANAFRADLKKNGITATVVTLGKPWHADVTGDRAYVVVPATFAYKDHGKAAVESGSIFTAALRKTAAGWHITGWAWTKH